MTYITWPFKMVYSPSTLRLYINGLDSSSIGFINATLAPTNVGNRVSSPLTACICSHNEKYLCLNIKMLFTASVSPSQSLLTLYHLCVDFLPPICILTCSATQTLYATWGSSATPAAWQSLPISCKVRVVTFKSPICVHCIGLSLRSHKKLSSSLSITVREYYSWSWKWRHNSGEKIGIKCFTNYTHTRNNKQQHRFILLSPGSPWMLNLWPSMTSIRRCRIYRKN